VELLNGVWMEVVLGEAWSRYQPSVYALSGKLEVQWKK
jgi:hypothetical protein